MVNRQYTCHTASIVFNVPRQTLYDRMKGKQSRQLAQEKQQVLSHSEEKRVGTMITRLTITGYPPRHKTLLEMTEEIRKRRVRDPGYHDRRPHQFNRCIDEIQSGFD